MRLDAASSITPSLHLRLRRHRAGSIQVPGNGQPIVLLVDRQTAGGYPKIATVISGGPSCASAGCRLARKIAFEPVTVETALALRRKLVAQIDAIHDRIVPLNRAVPTSVPSLLDSNLISGPSTLASWM